MFNKVIMVGRLTSEPELKVLKDGVSVCKFSIAVARTGNKDKTDFFKVVAWRSTAENVAKYLHKGSKALVDGQLNSDNYEKDGVKMTSFEIQASVVTFLDPPTNHRDETVSDVFGGVEESEIPF